MEGTAFQSVKPLGFTEKNSNNIFCINNNRWQKTNINGKKCPSSRPTKTMTV